MALQPSLWDRLLGVLKLQRPTYEVIRVDPAATRQAWLIVILTGLVNGLVWIAGGAYLSAHGNFTSDARRSFSLLLLETPASRVAALAGGVLFVVVIWFVDAWLLELTGTHIVRGQRASVTTEEVRRLIGWAFVPNIATILILIPGIGPYLSFILSFWALVTVIFAIRVAFDVAIGRAIAIWLVSALLPMLVLVVLFLVFGVFGLFVRSVAGG